MRSRHTRARSGSLFSPTFPLCVCAYERVTGKVAGQDRNLRARPRGGSLIALTSLGKRLRVQNLIATLSTNTLADQHFIC